jgi:hypothetical protein
MRAWELFEGVLTRVQVGKYQVVILDHVKDQLRKRNLRTWHISRILDKLPDLYNQIDQMELRQGFFVIDRKLQISLGMSRYNENTLTMITIIDTETPYAKDVDADHNLYIS